MKIARKIFISVFFSILTIPFLFFAWGLIKMEYEEHYTFGGIESAIIIDIGTESGSGSGEYGHDVIYEIEILKSEDSSPSIQFWFSINSPTSSIRDKEDDEFMLQSKVGDTVKVKIKSSNQAKLLEWQHLKLNRATDYWGIFWTWVVIAVLLAIPLFIYYKIYQKLKT